MTDSAETNAAMGEFHEAALTFNAASEDTLKEITSLREETRRLRAETKRIVAWLRHPDRYDGGPRAFWYANAADAIERGEPER